MKTLKGKKPKKQKVQNPPSYKEAGTLAQMRKAVDDAKTHRAWTLFQHEHRQREHAQNLAGELQRLSSQRAQIGAPMRYMADYMAKRRHELKGLRKAISESASSWQNL
jgi:hypothetical protein